MMSNYKIMINYKTTNQWGNTSYYINDVDL